MPDLMNTKDTEVYKTINGFQFSGVEIDSLEASEYTLGNILVDETGSVSGDERKIEECIKATVDACKKSPRSENLLMRVGKFGSHLSNSVEELHGFNLLSNIDVANYDGSIQPNGMTPLLDATLDSIETLEAQAKILVDQEYLCNGIFFVITDGGENCSRTADETKIKAAFTRIRKEEKLESIKSILIGVNDTDCSDELSQFKDDCGFDEYISMGQVTPGKLAKLAQWVSQSISSTSQALGTGGASQPIAAPSFNL
jgi:uncharacterized protein YegL